MTPILWSAIGMAIGAVVLHVALGLQRPLDRRYLSFACIMALVAVFLFLQWELYRSTSSAVAVHLKQHQVTVVNLFFACMFVFVPAYTSVRLPRKVTAFFWAGLFVMFVANIWLPYGLWFSGEPQLIGSRYRGESYTAIVAPPMGAPQLVYAAFFSSYLGVAMVCAVKMFRRGARQGAVTFAIALTIVVADALADVIRDNVGGSWPYVAEYGIVSWALIVSVQLARDFRENTQTLGDAIERLDTQARQLTSMLDALGALEHDMKRPLDTLEHGVVELAQSSTAVDPQLRRLERAITRIKELSRAMPEIHTHN